MQPKKLLIITITLAIIVAGIVASSFIFPKQETKKIDTPVGLSQAKDNLNSLASEAQTGLNPETINSAINSSATTNSFETSSASTSSISAITDIKQVTTKSFDDKSSLLTVKQQDLNAVGNLLRLDEPRNLMDVNLNIVDNSQIFFITTDSQVFYLGFGINTVEKITIDSKNYWFIIQVNLFEIPKFALFNENFSQKILIPTPTLTLFNSVKSISGSNVVISLKDENTTKLTDYPINLADYVDKLAPI